MNVEIWMHWIYICNPIFRGTHFHSDQWWLWMHVQATHNNPAAVTGKSLYRKREMWVGIWNYCLKICRSTLQPCGSIVFFIFFVIYWIMNCPGCSLMRYYCQRSSDVCHVTMPHLCSSVVQWGVPCLCPRSCFSPLELQPSKPLQPIIFALPFCQTWPQLINTTLELYINSWQACWPIILLMNANGPSHSESHSDMDTHAPLNMHTHIWICLSTSPLYYFVAMMKCWSWRPLAQAAPEVGLTPAVSHRRV